MDSAFVAAYAHLLKMEGGMADDPVDRGGFTYCGITQKYHPEWEGWDLVFRYKFLAPAEKALLTDLVRDFYYEEYWVAGGAARVAPFAPIVAMELFDAGVNCGLRPAGRWLQLAINAAQTGYSLADDGIIGAGTIEALQGCLPRMAGAILKMQKAARVLHYRDIAMEDRSQVRFIRGWVDRAGLS